MNRYAMRANPAAMLGKQELGGKVTIRSLRSLRRFFHAWLVVEIGQRRRGHLTKT